MSSETHECRDTGGNSYDLRGGLFRQMNTKDQARGGRFQGVPCFNGGLFADIHPLELTPAEIRILAEAADFDWSLVKPEIFRTLFQSSMDADECHAFGAHITSEFDIRKVVGPTIVRPWREKLEAPGTSSASSRKFSAISCKLPGYLNCALVTWLFELRACFRSFSSRQRITNQGSLRDNISLPILPMVKRFLSLLVVAHAFLSQSAYSAPVNDNLAAAIVVPGSGNSSNTTNVAATTESGERAHAGTVALKSIWWKWTCPTPAPAVAQMDTIGSNFDTRLGVYFDAGGSLQAVGSNDDSNLATATTAANRYSVVRIRPVATHTYFMAVDGFNGATGNVTFSVKTGASAGLPPANDNAASATSIGEVETLWGDTTPATVSEFDTPIENPPVTDRAAGRQLWYSYTPNVSATRLVSLRSPTRLLQAIIFSSGVGLTRMGTAGNLNSPPSDWTGAAFNFVAGTTYYICVISTSTSERHGPFELAVEPLPANDNLNAATVITAQSWVLNFNTLAASRESGEPLTFGGSNERTLWYRWKVPVTGLAWIDTQDSALDTAMNFRFLQDTTLPVNFSKLNERHLATDDVGFGKVKQSVLSAAQVTAGEVYYLQVSGEREENGRGRLFGTIVPNGSGRNAYTLWSMDRWRLADANTAPKEDYDGDGISNILEWFYGTNPLRPFTPYCDPQSGLFLPATYSSSTRILSHVLPLAPVNTSMSLLVPDLAIKAEHSSTLSSWQNAEGPIPTTNFATPPSPFWSTARIATPTLPANERAHFLRLKITLP